MQPLTTPVARVPDPGQGLFAKVAKIVASLAGPAANQAITRYAANDLPGKFEYPVTGFLQHRATRSNIVNRFLEIAHLPHSVDNCADNAESEPAGGMSYRGHPL